MLLSASCKKEKSNNPVDNLPPATQTGENTFGCLVNGEVFTAKNKALGSFDLFKEYTFYNGSMLLTVSAYNSKNNSQILIHIRDLEVKNDAKFILNSNDTPLGEYVITHNGVFNSYKTNLTNNRVLEVSRYDNKLSILSGKFSFDAVNANGEKVEIREGRFDLR